MSSAPATPVDTASTGRVSGEHLGCGRSALLGVLLFVSLFLGSLLVYLVFAIPGSWFPDAPVRKWTASDLSVTRGVARMAGDELILTQADPSGIALVAVTGDLRSSEYASVTWMVEGLADNAEAKLLWTTDVRPDKVNSIPIRVAAGHPLPVVVKGNVEWRGHIKGLAIAVHGSLAQPLRFKGVTASPMGARQVLGDRVGGWFAFEGWNGASINTIVGGDDYQEVPLPVLLAVVVILGAGVVGGLQLWRRERFNYRVPAVLAALFLAAWAFLDTRWTWNLIRQERVTTAQFMGKDARGKLLANEDAALYAFVERARAVLPPTPVRIVVLADADYFRGRAAYHLYPHNVYFQPRSNQLPAPTSLHAGDWLLVFQRRGIQFDASQGKLRWDTGETLNAEVKLVEPGAALFLIR